MLDPETKAQFDQQFRLIQIVYFALLAALFIYLGIGFALRPPHASPAGSSADLLEKMLYVLGGGIILVIFFLRKRLLRGITTSPQDLAVQVNNYRIGNILVFVLSESLGLMGLVLLFVTGRFSHFFRFILVSFVLMAILYPKKVDSLNP